MERQLRSLFFAAFLPIWTEWLQDQADAIDQDQAPPPGYHRAGRRVCYVQGFFGWAPLERDYYYDGRRGFAPADRALGLVGRYTPDLAYLLALAAALEGKGTPAKKQLVSRWKKLLLKDQVGRVIEQARQMARSRPANAQAIQQEIGYLDNHQEWMRYGTYRRAGYFIGAGSESGLGGTDCNYGARRARGIPPTGVHRAPGFAHAIAGSVTRFPDGVRTVSPRTGVRKRQKLRSFRPFGFRLSEFLRTSGCGIRVYRGCFRPLARPLLILRGALEQSFPAQGVLDFHNGGGAGGAELVNDDGGGGSGQFEGLAQMRAGGQGHR